MSFHGVALQISLQHCNPFQKPLRQASTNEILQNEKESRIDGQARHRPVSAQDFQKDVWSLSIPPHFVRLEGRSPNEYELHASPDDSMFKLISITAIAVGALLIALLSMETSRPGRPPSQRAVAVQIPQKKILRLAGEFHVRLLVAASERLDSTVMRDFGKVAGGQHLANEQEGLRPGSAGAR